MECRQDPHGRHHHERRHRPDGHESAPHAVDRGHPPARRRQEWATASRSCPSRSWWAATRAKLQSLAEQAGGVRWTTDLDAALADPRNRSISTPRRPTAAMTAVKQAIAAGKHVYCEKPAATTSADALEMYRLAQQAGLKNGVVQDKLWLPGLLKLKTLRDSGFFGRILSVRGEFGYWVFEGDTVRVPAPLVELSQGRRRRHHPRHALPLPLRARQSLRQRPGRLLPRGRRTLTSAGTKRASRTRCTADDSAYSTFEIGRRHHRAHQRQLVRPRPPRRSACACKSTAPRAAAVAGLRECWMQPSDATPRPVWNPDMPSPIDFYDSWQPVEPEQTFDNAFKIAVGAVPAPRRQGRAVPLDVCWKGPRAFNWPRRPWSHGRSGHGCAVPELEA